MANFADAANGRYNISHIPSDAEWGLNGRQPYHDRVLCKDGKTIVGWATGAVRYLALQNTNRYTIGIQLLSERDLKAARHWQFMRAQPPFSKCRSCSPRNHLETNDSLSPASPSCQRQPPRRLDDARRLSTASSRSQSRIGLAG